MKRFTDLAVVTRLMLTAVPSRADETNTGAPTIGSAEAAKCIGKPEMGLTGKSQLEVLNK
jgi:hypothetical protein